ncbi:hypothetical protein Tco_0352240 [Tanacetum coccineum]
MEDDKEKEDLKQCFEIVQDDDVAIDVIPLATKPAPIVGFQIHRKGRNGYYEIMRADGSAKTYLLFSQLLKEFDREDLENLWKLVKAKHRNTRPEEGYERRLYDSYRVHFVRFEDMHVYMLVKKRYPLTPATITDMLNKKLKSDYWNKATEEDLSKSFNPAWLTIPSWTMSISLTKVKMKCFTSKRFTRWEKDMLYVKKNKADLLGKVTSKVGIEEIDIESKELPLKINAKRIEELSYLLKKLNRTAEAEASVLVNTNGVSTASTNLVLPELVNTARGKINTADENRNSWVPIPVTSPTESGTSTGTKMTVPSTAEEKTCKKNDVKARSLLLMALPNEHQLTFDQYVDAQSMFAAIKARFGGNEATKKTQKALLKQQYENFNASSLESLDYIFNRLQRLVSRLAILGVVTPPEDLNVKFLRSLPSEWDTHVVSEPRGSRST